MSTLLTQQVTANPEKTELGLDEVEYVGHLISSTGTSFTDEKRLQVLDFPLPETEKALLQFIGLVNYFRHHVPHMTEMIQPLQGFQEVDLDIRECRSISLQSDRCIQLSRALFLRGLCNRLMHLIMVSGLHVHCDKWTSPRHSFLQQIPHWITVE